MGRPRRCRFCRKRPSWRYNGCPAASCKRCCHTAVWPDRPAAREPRRTEQPAADAAEAAVDALDVLRDGSRTGQDGSQRRPGRPR